MILEPGCVEQRKWHGLISAPQRALKGFGPQNTDIAEAEAEQNS